MAIFDSRDTRLRLERCGLYRHFYVLIAESEHHIAKYSEAIDDR